jgi:hypothetical protein
VLVDVDGAGAGAAEGALLEPSLAVVGFLESVAAAPGSDLVSDFAPDSEEDSVDSELLGA